MKNQPDYFLALRLELLLLERKNAQGGAPYVAFNSGQVCQALGCSAQELADAMLLLQAQGVLLKAEPLPLDYDGAIHLPN
jgi:hypothetical protein